MTARRRRVGSELDQGGDWDTISFPGSSSLNPSIYNCDETGSAPNKGLNLQPVAKMSSRDRTKEFCNAVQSLQFRQIKTVVRQSQDPRKAKSLQSYREFMDTAKVIGKHISSTYAKLEKLTFLAKRKSLFNDRPTEIQELTYIIKEDIDCLRKEIGKLHEVANFQKQSQQNNGRHHLLSHSSSVVIALQSKLASMSSEFKQVLEVRTESLKQAKARRDQFSSPLPSASVSSPLKNSVLLQDEQVAINLDNQLVPMQQQSMVQKQATMMYDETDQYLQSRAETMQNIESTIVELGGIFQQLAVMVKEQEEMVERIDSNVTDATLNVDAAHHEILRYFQSVSSNRWLMIKIFAVLIFFFLFFVIFMT
ncbi:unnamed protein product [Bemisia tabaci]|uniref:t-SNARE coiled-coil homology domain-containing protein n=1 Tax=Bemisia tabaci TaxID=7038 RepID=A0A9P0F6B5_BEMTA|nr:PREDICTED: syntaxin-5 [Bemisia tabaci]XP_018910836.1 PREDICTED: syntaxin-5 [Bemisia tabaci]CAH0393846.1 unnamed protein product [Bemisia tabaci]